MYECLVGYTPFYADQPVQTCKKILRWQKYLEVPMEVESQLSPECLSFLLSLMCDAGNRIGKVVEILSILYAHFVSNNFRSEWRGGNHGPSLVCWYPMGVFA